MPLMSLGHGLWMVLSKGAARLRGQRAKKHLVWDRLGYTLGCGCPEREAMAGRGTDGVCRMWGLRQGHVPSAHCREGMRASWPAPAISSRSFL